MWHLWQPHMRCNKLRMVSRWSGVWGRVRCHTAIRVMHAQQAFERARSARPLAI